MEIEEYTVFIPKGKYPMPWSLDDWCNEQFGNNNWIRSTKWDNQPFALQSLGQIYEFKTESDAVLFKLKWS